MTTENSSHARSRPESLPDDTSSGGDSRATNQVDASMLQEAPALLTHVHAVPSSPPASVATSRGRRSGSGRSASSKRNRPESVADPVADPVVKRRKDKEAAVAVKRLKDAEAAMAETQRKEVAEVQKKLGETKLLLKTSRKDLIAERESNTKAKRENRQLEVKVQQMKSEKKVHGVSEVGKVTRAKKGVTFLDSSTVPEVTGQVAVVKKLLEECTEQTAQRQGPSKSSQG